MASLKHVGRLIKNNRRVIVAYRVVPDEPENCIICVTESISADEHDSLMKAVESPAGQEANDFALVMARSTVPDGRNMLSHFHKTGKLIKVPTKDVEMVPNRNTSIMLNELNELIAQQQGVTVADLALSDGTKRPTPPAAKLESSPTVVESPVTNNEPLSDEDIARNLRSQADVMFKEAKQLRDQAEKLSPTKRTKKKETSE